MSGKTRRRKRAPEAVDEPQSEKLKPGPIRAGHTLIVACAGCKTLLAACKLTSSGHCDVCYFAGRIDQSVGEGRFWDWENYAQDYWVGKFNATETPSLPYESFAKIMRLHEMGLAPDVSQDRPLCHYDDPLHMWDGPPLGTPEEIEEENRRRWQQIGAR